MAQVKTWILHMTYNVIPAVPDLLLGVSVLALLVCLEAFQNWCP